jgi:septal ring factor EnvC (AmiA/AmiB activator)
MGEVMAFGPGKRLGLGLAAMLLAGTASLPLLAQSETTPSPTPATPAAEAAATTKPPAETPETGAPVEGALRGTITDSAAPAGATEPAVPTAADLEAVEASISLSQERIDALKAEIAEMEGDRTRQNAALIAAAQRVKLAEIEVADVEDRLSELIVRELEVRGRLDGSNAEIANVLAALERISLHPPPALIVDPDDALGSARSAILISAIVPQLRAKADAVTADLKALTEIKAQALAEEATLKANYAVLEEERLRIATLIVARKQGIAVRSEELAAEEAEAMALAARASTLQELIGSLSERASSVSTAEQAANAAIDPDAPALSAEQVRLALANSARTEPAVPFGAAKGYLTMPTNGVNVLDYGAGDGFGGISRGISVVTRAEAQVVAPADGWVLYKGPYLNYGQIIILNTGQNYTMLLAGLETVIVDIGQFVQMGMPLGTMGSRTIGRSVTTNAGATQPTLYIELRQDNEPVDPTGWWANPTQSG